MRGWVWLAYIVLTILQQLESVCPWTSAPDHENYKCPLSGLTTNSNYFKYQVLCLVTQSGGFMKDSCWNVPPLSAESGDNFLILTRDVATWFVYKGEPFRFNYHFLRERLRDWWSQLGQWQRWIGRPPKLLIIRKSHQLQSSAGGGNHAGPATRPHGMLRLMELLQTWNIDWSNLINW